MKVVPPSEIRTISAAEFKAKCLQLMDEVNEKDLTFVVTKRGRPVLYVTAPPKQPQPFVPLWGRTPGIRITGDIVSPLPEEWTLPKEVREKKYEGAKSKGKEKREK